MRLDVNLTNIRYITLRAQYNADKPMNIIETYILYITYTKRRHIDECIKLQRKYLYISLYYPH